MEIALLLLVLVLVLGPGRAAALAGKLFGMARKVDETKRSLTNPTGLLQRIALGGHPRGKEGAPSKKKESSTNRPDGN